MVIGRTTGTPHLNYKATNTRVSHESPSALRSVKTQVYSCRLDEIKAWLREHPHLVERYVILDDRDVVPSDDPMYSRFVQPTYSRGITVEEAVRVKALLEDPGAVLDSF